ncbi:glycosyl hydrolase [Asticcacaulis sp. AND118]|uniref:glycosyl hydrolase n=1 Tax=Asticcacaulis sp. AND118 TaxID=2840468 RepID=UPI001CFFA11F|nr:glycosyl hydrolase [Asticcacaulis sp. AND118]UDF03575.1 hypothetical protein LH365_00605 [Asticcacaulis sp. AND118]
MCLKGPKSLRPLCALSLTALLWAGSAPAQSLYEGFTHPPVEARPMVRWWWFGPNVDDAEIVREIKAMKAGGYGGFELASLYPLTVDGNTPYLSDRFIEAVKLANKTGRKEGLRVDVTLGSGWPYGGPHITPDLAAARVKLVKLSLPAKSTTIDLPALQAGEQVVAVFAGTSAVDARLIDPGKVTADAQDRTAFVVLQTPTGQQVKRASVGAEGYVLDHMATDAVQTHLHAVGDRLMRGFKDAPPHAVFSDSLEVYGVDWTDDLLIEFQKRRGYDLKPHLLKWFEDTPDSAAVRRDWGLTLAELTEERYLKPVNDWAAKNRTLFRSQTYGHPPVRLSAVRLSDIAEGEGADWRIFSRLRWVSSANHLYGKSITSAESWTWLHQGAFQAAPLDVKAEADTLILQGVNHFIAHGWPYSPPQAGEPGWAMYAAAVFNDHNPWWIVAPEMNLYLQRMSWLLRQGEPVTDIAIYVPQDDALAASKPGSVSIDGQLSTRITRGLTAQILDAGYNFDYVDDAALNAPGFKHKVLVLPKMQRIDPRAYARIEAFAQSGGKVVAVDGLPDRGAGLNDRDADMQAISTRLFAQGAVPESALGATLTALTAPDVTGLTPQVGFVHRKLEGSDLYFVANTGNTPVTLNLRFRGNKHGLEWNPIDGSRSYWANGPVRLAPYESRLFEFGKNAVLDAWAMHTGERRVTLDTGWTIAFGKGAPRPLKAFGSWSDNPETAHFSGVVTYRRTLTLTQDDIVSGLTRLNFGEGTPEPIPTGRRNGSQAFLNAPIREAAEVFVNGERAGAVWTSPFVIDLRGFLVAGNNILEIRVANTTINALSAQTPADYTALKAKYGDRFQPQNMNNLKPLPSGLLQAPVLEIAQ